MDARKAFQRWAVERGLCGSIWSRSLEAAVSTPLEQEAYHPQRFGTSLNESVRQAHHYMEKTSLPDMLFEISA